MSLEVPVVVPTRRRLLLLLVGIVLVLAGLVPLLRANAAAQRRMWEESCTRAGGAVFSQPADLTNPLVVHTGHPLDECRSATGVLVSTRD
ncbi:hypothetical protein [Microlunatus antarcticus]|uniref:Uncharacterized protein n=1 Tax=Microlunatus antarcticus TaxID=53388 RepID=A0A7W5JU22_9ACTN|nr:hypothetical protein [Microlunatus antarcticus]MBB3325772.1 hypothetical protein [Microlunatus antarcticus]